MPRRLSLLACLLTIAACGGGGGGDSSTPGTGASSSSSSSSGGAPGQFQYGNRNTTRINLTAAVQDESGSLSLQLDDQTFRLRVTTNGYAPISEFSLNVDAQGASFQICQNGVGLFNVFPADASPVSAIGDIAGQNFFSVSLCSSGNLQGDYLNFNSSGLGVHFNAGTGSTSLLLPGQVAQMLSPSCVATSDNCLRIFRIVRNGTPYHFIHAPWPGGLRLWQGPGLRPF